MSKFNPFDASNNVYANGYAGERNKFLNSFSVLNVLCYNNNPKKKLSGMNHTSDIGEVLHQNVMNNCDAYFYVNGHRKKQDVRVVRACYIDLDAGRNANGHYHAPKVVIERKAKFMDMIEKFPVKPTWIVDTRNGYQVYWILDANDHKLGLTLNMKYWNGIQKKLANYFNADIRAMKINQIFRIPFTWWRKPWEGKKSYFCTIMPQSTGEPVSMVNLQSALTGQSAQVVVKSSNSSDAWYEKIRTSKHTENGVPLDVNVAQKLLNDLVTKDYTHPTIIGENDDIPDYDESDESNPVFDAKYVPNEQQLRLLSSVLDFLNQVSTPLFFSNNKFLSSSAKELAAKLSDEFCIG